MICFEPSTMRGQPMRKISTSSAYALFLLSVASGVAAQSFQGGLRGAVREGEGIIPGVSVTLVNEATGATRDTVSNESGEYAFAAVTPGTYSVRATLQGFKTFERKGITIGTQ